MKQLSLLSLILSDLSLSKVEQLRNFGHISDEVFDQWFAVWFYSAPRFADGYPFERVRDINAYLDVVEDV
jgi:hypothetical protein